MQKQDVRLIIAILAGLAMILIGAFCSYIWIQKLSSLPQAYWDSAYFFWFVVFALLMLCGAAVVIIQVAFSYDRSIKPELNISAGDLARAVDELSKNYAVLRSQTTQGFVVTAVFMFLGLVVIVTGSLGQLFGSNSGGASITTIAGLISEFISGTALVLYKLNFNRMNITSETLDETWRLLAAFDKAQDLDCPGIIEELIRKLGRLDTRK